MITKTHGYAASAAKGLLQPFEFDLGELGPEEVEIKVTHCGICHSDLSMLDNEWGLSEYPFVPGHEDRPELRKNDRVGRRQFRVLYYQA